MITVDLVIREVRGLTRDDLERWIANQWVRPDHDDSGYVFCDIDLARVRLIHDLTTDLQVNDEALPVVLSLLDQLYDLHRRMRDLGEAINRTAPPEMRATLIACLTNTNQP
ncbi:MAG: chaperone modulator CbpM [Acidiphilium sp.]|nr:chaperone modulator CbpM [Acidiphilium sp.]MDD4936231.1 chaperone modulator CbpM [Acidiphilium sp.]